MSTLHLAAKAVPVASVGTKAVKEEHGRLATRFPFRLPFDVVETDAASLEPSVGRFAHRL